MKIATSALAIATLLLSAGAVDAQGNGRSQGVPPGHLPPAGQCRVWHDGTPPGRQPRATDCRTAEWQARRSGGRVIYGASRYDHDGRYDRDDECRDGDRDGRCDWAESRDRSGCVDVNRDGRCDVVGRSRTGSYSLPVMIDILTLQRGGRSADYVRWIGDREARPSWTDANRDGRAERITWRDTRGGVIQLWEDTNRDGRADRVRVYQNGRLVADHH